MGLIHAEPAETLGDTTPGAFDHLPPLQEHRAVREAREATRLPGWFPFAAVVVVALVFLLSGCGGGDCDADCQKDFDPLDCKARPELCV